MLEAAFVAFAWRDAVKGPSKKTYFGDVLCSGLLARPLRQRSLTPKNPRNFEACARNKRGPLANGTATPSCDSVARCQLSLSVYPKSERKQSDSPTVRPARIRIQGEMLRHAVPLIRQYRRKISDSEGGR